MHVDLIQRESAFTSNSAAIFVILKSSQMKKQSIKTATILL